MSQVDQYKVSAHVIKGMEAYCKNPKASNNYIRANMINMTNIPLKADDMIYVWKNYTHYMSLVTLKVADCQLGDEVCQ